MDIYAYLEQIRLFLSDSERREIESLYAVSAELVMRFQKVTIFSIVDSKRFLAQFSPTQQIQCIELAEKIEAERGERSFVHDPIEDDPAIRPLFESVREEVSQEVEEWRQQRIADLGQSSPMIAALYRGSGLCHRNWARIKQLLWERYQIEWRSPQEMNPWSTFD